MFGRVVHGEEGEVTAVHGDTTIVKVRSSRSCEKCRLCTRISDTEMIVQAYTVKPVRVGDRVILGFRPGIIVKSAFILYLIPLFAMIVGYYVGKLLFHSYAPSGKEELFPALLSLVFLFSSFIPIRLYDKRKEKDRRFRIYIKGSV